MPSAPFCLQGFNGLGILYIVCVCVCVCVVCIVCALDCEVSAHSSIVHVALFVRVRVRLHARLQNVPAKYVVHVRFFSVGMASVGWDPVSAQICLRLEFCEQKCPPKHAPKICRGSVRL